jgi:serine/threonine protein kinase
MVIGRGTRFGSYEITSLLGSGGMGEVYRARDTVLRRDVAIKVLQPAFSGDSQRLARFEREARVLAALNHPHIAAIYGIESAQDVSAIVLELVEGETLAEVIRRAPLPVAEALRLAGQIAEALDAAHKLGIVHRDLKPANIKLTTDGLVKVLDFGLAKTADGDAPALSESPTVAVEGTRTGVVLGTAGYMSPEQARGHPVDVRSDIWSFGCVAYEMLAGRRAFGGPTASDTIARILEREPDWTALPRATPRAIRDLLKRCLQKDPDARASAIRDVHEVVDRALARGRRAAVPRAPVLAGAAILALASALGGVLWFRSNQRRTADRSQWEQLTNFPDSAVEPALSPDGRMLAFIRGDSTFAARGEVYLKLLPDGDPTPLTRDGSLKLDPAFSPDGKRLAYTRVGNAAMTGSWDTWLLPVIRGEPRSWLRNASGLSWVGHDRILFSEISRGRHMGIVTSTESRTDSRELYFPEHEDGMAHRSSRSPDGKWVLVVEMNEGGVFTPCRLIPDEGGSAGRLVGPAPSRCTGAAWHPAGMWMYFAADAGDGFHVWRQRFPDGRPEQLTTGAITQEEGLAIAADGRSLVTSVGQQQRGVWIRDRSGERKISLEGYAFWPLFSADGKRLCFRVAHGIATGQSATELWMTELDSGRVERLLAGQRVTQYDLSREDRVVAAVPEADGKSRLWLTWLDGREAPRRLADFEATNPRFGATDAIYFNADEAGSVCLFRTNPEGTIREKVIDEKWGRVLGQVSPDGSWLSAWVGPDTFVFPTVGGSGVRILEGAVSRLRWSPDGSRALLAVQDGGSSAFGFGRTYVLPLERGSMLPRMPPGGFRTEAEIAALPGVDVLPYGDVTFSPTPGVYAFSRITVTRNLFRIPLR